MNPRCCRDYTWLDCGSRVCTPSLTAIDACLHGATEACEQLTRAIVTLRGLGLNDEMLASAESKLLASRRKQLWSLVEAARSLTVFTAPGATAHAAEQVATLRGGIESHGAIAEVTATLLGPEELSILAARQELQRLEQAVAKQEETRRHLHKGRQN